MDDQFTSLALYRFTGALNLPMFTGDLSKVLGVQLNIEPEGYCVDIEEDLVHLIELEFHCEDHVSFDRLISYAKLADMETKIPFMLHIINRYGEPVATFNQDELQNIWMVEAYSAAYIRNPT